MKPVVAHFQSTYVKLTENWIAVQIDGLTEHEVLVLAKRTRNAELFARQRVVAFASQPYVARQVDRLLWRARGYSPLFLRTCRRNHVGALHAWFGYSGLAMLGLAQRLGVPLITSFLGSDMTRGGVAVLRRRYAELFSKGALFLAEGPAARDQLLQLGCPAHKLRVARIAIDTARIPVKPRVRSTLEPLHILMAARFTEKKGLPYGVEAFCRFVAGGGEGKLVIVGGGTDAEGEGIGSELHRIATEYGCAGRVIFAGWQQPAQLLEHALEAHVFMHPSVTAANGDAEGGHPVVLTELAASAMPIIATWHCDIPEIVRNQQSGWLVDERDTDGLVAALRDAYAHPHKLLAFGEHARRLAVEKYDVAANRLDAHYRHLGI